MAMVCPYCRTGVEEGEGVSCEGCGTPHHAECYAENGGCTLFGCKFAPPDDPKVQVTVGDVSQAAVFGNVAQTAYMRPTGFGDVNAPVALSTAIGTEPLPPPPPPGSELRPPADASPSTMVTSTLFGTAVRPPKSRLIFILLGIFLGPLGVHNFYAGYVKRGLGQLCLTVVTFFYAWIVTWIWAVVEVCTVDRDHDNISFV
jgi:TM2 domain-containing membrane protein YozV